VASEEQIAAALLQKTNPEPELNPPYPDETPEEGRDTSTNSLPLEGSQMTMELMDYFNLGTGARHNSDTQNQMNEILTWAKQNAESPDLAGVLRTLRHTEVILASTLKPDRLARIYRYVRIQQQKSLIAERERALYA
jgi:hypothetical protein